MNGNLPRISAILTIACLCIGCSDSEYPAVSGQITYEGKPLANVQVVFNPVSNSTADVAPYSTAVTDDEGVFSLKTRDGQSGAVVGQHRVGFSWSDIKSYTVRNYKQALSETKDDPERQAELKQQLATAKQKLDSRPALKADLQTEFTVPTAGADNVNFELTDF